jgi:hypothetical protein
MNEHLTDRGIAFEGGKMCFDVMRSGRYFVRFSLLFHRFFSVASLSLHARASISRDGAGEGVREHERGH